MIDKRQKRYQAFGGEFLGRWIMDLNHLSEEGWSLMVEGERDVRAMRKLGYAGIMVTTSGLAKKGIRAIGGAKKVVILTDLDREGSVLVGKLSRRLAHEGLVVSTHERLRLKAASRGVFLHIENLSRFAETET